ncbi:MAG: TolC family protein [Bdellovibrionota bacterium]
MFRVLFLFFVVTSTEAATTLKESFQAALNQSESLESQEKLVLATEERSAQVRGSILPNLTGNASYMIQDRPTDPLAESFFPRNQPEAKLTLRQPIFRGFREFGTLRQFGRLNQAEKHAYENAKLSLYSDVAQSYHAVLAAEENLRNINEQLGLYDERIGDLKRRVGEGTSSEADLLALQSSRATVQSQLKTAQAGLVAAREAFVFLTGLPSDTPLAPPEQSQPKPQPVEEYLKSIEGRPDVLDSSARLDAADEQVGISKGGHAPSVDLVGNYYFKRQSDVYKGIDWDVQAVFSLPIFAGGAIRAQVTESVLQRERAELDLGQRRRQAQQQIRTLHSEYVAGLESISALEQGLRLAEKNYQLLKRDFRRGLTRNLDVLQSLISAHDLRRELLRARFVARDRWVQLNVAAGRDPLHE